MYQIKHNNNNIHCEEERQLYYEIGLRINWNCISQEEWEQMKQRNEQSKALEQLKQTRE